MKKSVTMSDIGKALGVSTVTVSKALTGKEGVGQALREKICAAAKEMGYHYNTIAKGMRDGLTYNVGVVISRRFVMAENSFYWNMYQHILSSLSARNYYGIFILLTDEDEQQLIMPHVVKDNKVDALIMLGQVSTEYAESVLSLGLPVVFLDFYDRHFHVDTVVSDNFFGSYLMTDHLIRAGHRQIGFVGNVHATSSIQDRFLGYCKAMLENRLDYRNDWIISDRDESGQIYKKFVLPVDMPTAFVCNCDTAAYEFIRCLKENGYQVPEQISITGYDNFAYSSLYRPSLTTIEVNVDRMASEAVEIVLKKIADPSYHSGRVVIEGNVIIRDSVRILNK